MGNYKLILETAIYSIPIFVILGIYFLIYVLFGKYPTKIKKLIYLAGIFVLLTIIIPWIYIRIATGALAFILLWSSLFLVTSKKDVLQIGLAITFMVFPAVILLCFFYSMGWAFNHSSGSLQPYMYAIWAVLIYLAVIWIPVFIKCIILNIKDREGKGNKQLSEELEDKSQEADTSKKYNSFFKINFSSIMFIIIIVFLITSNLRWIVKLDGGKTPGRSILKEKLFESEISLMTINSGLINSFHIAVSPKKNAKLKILWDRSSYSINSKDQGKQCFVRYNKKSKVINIPAAQEISEPTKFNVFPRNNHRNTKFMPLKDLKRGVVHCVRLVIVSDGKEYIHSMKVKIIRSIGLGYRLWHPLGLFSMIRIPLISVLLTVIIISKSSSLNIKIFLALAALNLFFLSLWDKENLFFALMISFVFYLIPAWLSKKNKEIFAILIINLLLIISIFKSIYYFYLVYFKDMAIDKTVFTIISTGFLLVAVLLTAYIKYLNNKKHFKMLINDMRKSLITFSSKFFTAKDKTEKIG